VVPGLYDCKVVQGEGREGEGRERRPAPVQRRENPRGPKAQESILTPTRAKNPGSNEGYGWPGGIKPLRRRQKAYWSFGKARERKGTGKPVSDHQVGARL